MIVADILNPSCVLGIVLKAKGLKSSSSSIIYVCVCVCVCEIHIPKLYFQVSPDLKIIGSWYNHYGKQYGGYLKS